MQQPFWRLPVCSEPPAAPNIPPRQPEKPFARADCFSGCFILQATYTFMLAMGWVFVFWAVEAVVVRIYAAEMCKQAGVTVYVTPEQWRNLTKESADNLRKNAPFYFRNDNIIFDGKEFEFFHPLSEFDGVDDYIYLPKDKNYTTLYYEIYFDKRFQVILFKNLRIYTRSASPGNSYKFWIDSTPRCGNSAFDYFSEHYLISQPTMNR